MKSPQLCCCLIVLGSVAAGCHRASARDDVKQDAQAAAADIKTKSAEAKDHLADAWITTQVKSKLVGDRELRARDIDVDTHDGVVILKGKVLNEPLRQLAIVLAQRTDGVKQVVDQLQVQVAPPPQVQANRGTAGAVATNGSADANAPLTSGNDDARIATAIQSKYFQDDRIKGRHIEVTSHAGVVTLRGDVADDTERAQALLLARTTNGVTRVEDNLSVGAATAPTDVTGPVAATPTNATAAPDASTAAAPGNAPPAAKPVNTAGADDALSARVQSQLSSDPQVKATPLDVTVKNGVVLLQGTVSTAAAKQRALTLARGIDGVTQVVDRVQVGAKNGKAKK
jgi:osmotically-inducible protein OsmY